MLHAVHRPGLTTGVPHESSPCARAKLPAEVRRGNAAEAQAERWERLRLARIGQADRRLLTAGSFRAETLQWIARWWGAMLPVRAGDGKRDGWPERSGGQRLWISGRILRAAAFPVWLGGGGRYPQRSRHSLGLTSSANRAGAAATKTHN